jgi:hypothetical protein
MPTILEIQQMTLEQTQALTAEELATWTQEQVWILTKQQIAWLGAEKTQGLPLNEVQQGQNGYMANGVFVPFDNPQ